MRSIFLFLLGIALTASVTLRAEAAIQPWSENVFKQLENEYGAEASRRMRSIHDVMIQNKDQPLRKKLEIVNDTLNALPWVTDRSKWSAEDYWATPLETIALYGGDCEDMAIGKYMALRLMGVPRKNLYLGYVKVKATGESHMVMVWVNDQRSAPLAERSR